MSEVGHKNEASGQSAAPVIVECENCHARMRARRWRAGIECPKCKAGMLRPFKAPGGAAEYMLADRSEGYAMADIRVAQWAKWSGTITPHQYEVAFVKQRGQVSAGGPVQPIHEILQAEEALTEEDALALLEFTLLPRPNWSDENFAKRVVTSRIAAPEQVESVKELQHEIAKKHREVPPLAQLLFEKRVIDEAQLLALLKMQQTDGTGPLAKLADMIEANRKETLYGKFAQGVKAPKRQMKNLALVVVMFLAAFFVWYYQAYGNRPKVAVKCAKCRKEFVIPWPRGPLQRCPGCGERKLQFQVKCIKCGKVYCVDSLYDTAGHRCPNCNGRTAVPLLQVQDWEKAHGKVGRKR